MTTTTTETAIDRLRKSKSDYLASINEEGRADGRLFAMEDASYKTLVKLAAVDLDEAPDNETGARGWLAQWVAEQTEHELEYFFAGDVPLDDFAAAFFRGAVEYFNQVRRQI